MSRKKGFTLLEILIVLAIVGIMSAVVVLNVSSPSYATFLSNARKISATLGILSDQAAYTNSIIVCNVETNSLSCKSYKNGNWTDLNLQNIISWSWPQNLTIEQVYVNGAPLKQGEKIKFLATGDQIPMSFQVTDGRYTTWIDGDLNGNFEVNN